jgi:DNA-binding LacI/PurR family transcriptional regulator
LTKLRTFLYDEIENVFVGGNNMSVTIKDIAKRAGVSITTVSRALNGYPDIHPRTRERVLRIADEMNFRPSAVARSLVMKKSKTIGLIISELTCSSSSHHFIFDIIRGVHDQAALMGYDVILSATSPHKQQEISYMELCTRRQLDGVLLMGVRTDDRYLQEVLDASVPCMLIDVPLVSKTCGHVMVDNVRGARMAVQHLVDLGHRRIGMINGHQQAYVSFDRLKGYRQALEENGLTFDPDQVFDGNFEEDSGIEGVSRLLSRFPDMTALFCASDMMAVGAIRALHQWGKRVPDDVAVVGYDDIDLVRYIQPPLTTIHQPRYQMGTKASELLIHLLSGGKGETVVLEPQLIVRESTKR